MDMLLEENAIASTLNFEINKDISLRTFLGDKIFKQLVFTAVEIVGETDRTQSACLLDKIGEKRKVLQTLIQIQFTRIQRTKPLRFITTDKEIQVVRHNQQSYYQQEFFDRNENSRVMSENQFYHMLEEYKKAGEIGRNRDLFNVLEQLDQIA